MKKKTFKNHFDKFPPILREMIMEGMSEEKKNHCMYFHGTPLLSAFYWDDNPSFSEHDFWSAVNQDAKARGVWKHLGIKPSPTT